MRIFVIEYITGGGLLNRELTTDLLPEAETMLKALLDDLSALADIELLLSRDPRLPPPRAGCEMFVPAPGDDIWKAWGHCIDRCDAVWPIMPESGGLLQRISRLVLARGRRLLGSHPQAVALASSKFQTAMTLAGKGIEVVPTFRVDADIPRLPGRWVVKPDDGVGCDGIRIFESHADLCRALARDDGEPGWVVQPYIGGRPASLSMLCCHGDAALLSGNIQQIDEKGDRFDLKGILVNGLPYAYSRYRMLARAIAGAIPRLWGYVGVDLILTARGPLVLEVNPRLSVSYAGLHAALGANPAKLILGMLQRGGSLPPCAPVACSEAPIPLEIAHVA